jgi:hypothetical protein
METEKKQGFNKNEKQVFFNQVKGRIEELNDGDRWCSITLLVGHENQRLVNLCLQKDQYDKYKATYKIGQKVSVRFFLTSRFRHERWHTTANVLSIESEEISGQTSPETL